MLPLLLLCNIAVSIGAPPAYQCDLSKVAIEGGNYKVSDDQSKVEYSCPKGKYPFPGPIRECNRLGRWTEERRKAECKAIECPRVVSFDGGDFSPPKQKYFVGDVITFDCFGGYTLVGPENRTCQENGKWSGKTTTCNNNEGHCPNPGIPIGATKVGSSYRIEDKVSYACLDGLKMFGSSRRQCQEDTTWSGAEPSCRNWYAYDPPDEVAQVFASSLAETIASSDPNRVEEKGDRKLQITAGGPMNIFIIIDASKSVGEDNFNTAKDIAKTFIEKVSTYDFAPRYCIITYASEPKIIISIAHEDNAEADIVIEKIEEFKYKEHDDKQGTNTRGALQFVYNELSLLQVRHPEKFFETSNILLLMTDGKHNMGGDPSVEVRRIREFLNIRKDNDRESKLDIYVFGVGEDISLDELNDIASKKNNEKHVFKMESIDEMKKAFDEIIDETQAFEMCGISKDHSDDVKEKYPWIARIVVTRPDGVENCKGSIITQNFILTAAHCFHLEDPPHFVTVSVGDKSYKAKDIHRHPLYDPNGKKDKNIKKSFDSDIALIELPQKLEYSTKIRPICLPCTSGASWALKLRDKVVTCPEHLNILVPETQDQVQAVFITEDRKKDNFQEMSVTIKQGAQRQNCLDDAKKIDDFKDVENIEDVVTENFYCSGGTQPQLEPQTCKGDSGGPLMTRHKHRYVQMGVISWGTINTCEGLVRKRVKDGSRDFHASVPKGMEWIVSIAKEELILLK